MAPITSSIAAPNDPNSKDLSVPVSPVQLTVFSPTTPTPFSATVGSPVLVFPLPSDSQVRSQTPSQSPSLALVQGQNPNRSTSRNQGRSQVHNSILSSSPNPGHVQQSHTGANSALCPVAQSPRCFSAFSSPRPVYLDFSIIWQLDGLMHAIKRCRLERDACAQNPQQSYCTFHGRGYSPLSTACSLFFPSLEDAPRVLAAAIAERAKGLFIIQVSPFFGPATFDGRTAYEFLAAKAVLTFDITGLACRRVSAAQSGVAFAPLTPFKAFLVFFGVKDLAFRSIPHRRERLFSVSAIAMPPVDSTLIRCFPFCPDRFSHLAGLREAPVKPDLAPAGPPFQPSSDTVDVPRRALWDSVKFNSAASLYPFTDVADLAREATSIDGFKIDSACDRRRHVPSTNMIKSPADIDRVRLRLLEEVAAGRMLGPFASPPFPNSGSSAQIRPPPLGVATKEKYNPASDKFRLVVNFSVHDPYSFNDLCWSPKMVGVHLQASDIMTVLVVLGRAARVRAYDQEKAYRNQWIHRLDLHLFVYALTLREHFQDLRHPFGSLPSAFCFWCITAVLIWAAHFNGIVTPGSVLFHFVDNYWLFSTADDASHESRGDLLFSFVSGLGPSLHEEQKGTAFEGLGWEWDTIEQTITCPVLKRTFFTNQMAKFCQLAKAQGWLKLKQIEKLVGVLQWLKAACPSLGCLQSGARVAMALSRNRRSLRVDCAPHSNIVSALNAASLFLSSWNGSKKFFLPFSPRFSWDILVRTDASTEFGWGGAAFPFHVGCYGAWSHAERALALRCDPSGAPTLKSASTVTFELLALRNTLRFCQTLVSRGFAFAGKRVQFELDAEAAVLCLRKFYSDIPPILAILEEIRTLCIELDLVHRFEHILRDFNCIADALSKNSPPQAVRFYAEEFGSALAVEGSSQ